MEYDKVIAWEMELEFLQEFLNWIYEHPELDIGEETYTGFTRSTKQPFLVACEFLGIDGEKALQEARSGIFD